MRRGAALGSAAAARRGRRRATPRRRGPPAAAGHRGSRPDAQAGGHPAKMPSDPCALPACAGSVAGAPPVAGPAGSGCRARRLPLSPPPPSTLGRCAAPAARREGPGLSLGSPMSGALLLPGGAVTGRRPPQAPLRRCDLHQRRPHFESGAGLSTASLIAPSRRAASATATSRRGRLLVSHPSPASSQHTNTGQAARQWAFWRGGDLQRGGAAKGGGRGWRRAAVPAAGWEPRGAGPGRVGRSGSAARVCRHCGE